MQKGKRGSSWRDQAIQSFQREIIQSWSICKTNEDMQIVFLEAQFKLYTELALFNPRSLWTTSWKWQTQLVSACLCCGNVAFIKLKYSACRKTSQSWLIYLLKLIKRAGQIILEMHVAFKRFNRVLITYLMFKSYWEETVDCDWGRRQTGCSSAAKTTNTITHVSNHSISSWSQCDTLPLFSDRDTQHTSVHLPSQPQFHHL